MTHDNRASVRNAVVDAYKEADPDWEEPEGIRDPDHEERQESTREARTERRRPAMHQSSEETADAEEAPQEAAEQESTARDAAPTSWSKEAKGIFKDLPART